MTKLLIIIALAGAAVSGVARSHSEPPLLIDSQSAPAPLDAAR